MGEVWRADDLVLGTPVALKLIYSADPEARKRILNEVRLARQITHPAICRVFDVGEGAGEVFYSMELVDGEDLATLVRRMGRLPIEKVIDIGQQLCDGLAAAHAQGILHRDLKPANVLIDADGLVRITDFGIAITRDGANDATLIGTPRYMAPEQLDAAAPLSERTDIYALGLILYELLVGRPAYDLAAGRTAPAAKTVGADQRCRPGTRAGDREGHVARSSESSGVGAGPVEPAELACETGSRVAGCGSQVRSQRRRCRMWPFFSRRGRAGTVDRAGHDHPRGLSEHDGRTGVRRRAQGGACGRIGAVAVPQGVSRRSRAREALRLMQRPADERLTREMAREIARREQLKALVAGSIASLGSHYVLALEAIDAETGEVLAREQVEVPAKEQVLALLGSITSKLREKLGESLALIERFDAPLAQATTGSLDALHAYSLALDQGRIVPRLEARAASPACHRARSEFRHGDGAALGRVPRTTAARLRRRSIPAGRSSCATASASANASSSRGATTSTPSRRGTRRWI